MIRRIYDQLWVVVMALRLHMAWSIAPPFARQPITDAVEAATERMRRELNRVSHDT